MEIKFGQSCVEFIHALRARRYRVYMHAWYPKQGFTLYGVESVLVFKFGFELTDQLNKWLNGVDMNFVVGGGLAIPGGVITRPPEFRGCKPLKWQVIRQQASLVAPPPPPSPSPLSPPPPSIVPYCATSCQCCWQECGRVWQWSCLWWCCCGGFCQWIGRWWRKPAKKQEIIKKK